MNVVVPLLAIALSGVWPVSDPAVVRDFDPPATTWAAGHRGIDLAASTGDPVRSMSAGVVAFVGTIAGKPLVTVALAGRLSLRSTYEPVLAVVRIGQAVAPGTLLGTVAQTGGHCGGLRACLHVGLRSEDRYLDPRTLIGRVPAVLKPVGAPD